MPERQGAGEGEGQEGEESLTVREGVSGEGVWGRRDGLDQRSARYLSSRWPAKMKSVRRVGSKSIEWPIRERRRSARKGSPGVGSPRPCKVIRRASKRRKEGAQEVGPLARGDVVGEHAAVAAFDRIARRSLRKLSAKDEQPLPLAIDDHLVVVSMQAPR